MASEMSVFEGYSRDEMEELVAKAGVDLTRDTIASANKKVVKYLSRIIGTLTFKGSPGSDHPGILMKDDQ